MKKRYITKTYKEVWLTLRVLRIETFDGEFEYFLSQVMPEEQHHIEKLVNIDKPDQVAMWWRQIRKNWPAVAMLLGALSVITAEVIRQLEGGK